jgi:cytochrome o ubiquinol oxidase subunit II
VPAADFAAWVKEVRGAGSALDEAGYTALAKPSKAVPPTTYGLLEPNLFEHIIEQTVSGSQNAGATAACGRPVQQAGE